MSKFQKEIEQLLVKQDKELNERLAAAYQQTLKEIKAQVKEDMAKYADLTYSRKMEAKRLYSLMLQIEKELDVLSGVQQDHVYHFLNSVGELAYNELLYDFERTNGLMLNFTMLNRKTLETIINTPIKNIKLSDRLKDGSTTKLKASLQEVLSRGYNKGWSYQKMAQQLSEAGESSFKRSMNIARTEGGRVSSVTRQKSQTEAVKKGLDLEKEWISTLDLKTRDSHAQLDGQAQKIDEYFEVGGHKALQPHMFGVASEDCNCRCRTITKVKGYDLAERRDNLTKESIGYKNYEEWLSHKNKEIQNQISKKDYPYISEKDYKQLIKESGKIRTTDKLQIYGGQNGYVGTPNSFDINSALRDRNTNNLSKESLKTIDTLQKLIKENTLQRNITVNRWVDGKWLADFMTEKEKEIGELTMENLLKYLNSGKKTLESGGFVSTSLLSDRNLFKNRGVRLEIQVAKKSNVFVTENIAESEMILNKGTKYEIIKGQIESNKIRNILVITMRLIG